MPEMITFPRMGKDRNHSLTATSKKQLAVNSSGGSKDENPPKNGYSVEDRAKTYLTVTGNPHTTSGFKSAFNTGISNAYWMTTNYGADPRSNPKNSAYSPLFDAIFKGVTFDYEKRDSSTNTKNRFKMWKMGVVYRASDSSMGLCDLTTDGGNLFQFTGSSDQTFKGSCDLDCIENRTLSHVMGFYFQFRTEGGGKYPSSSYVTIKNMRFKSTKSNEAILMPRSTFNSKNVPSGARAIWTE